MRKRLPRLKSVKLVKYLSSNLLTVAKWQTERFSRNLLMLKSRASVKVMKTPMLVCGQIRHQLWLALKNDDELVFWVNDWQIYYNK